jgi:hypothetical protein
MAQMGYTKDDSENRYNGWTNYATWRVNLEMFDCSDWHCRIGEGGFTEAHDLAAALKDWAEEWIEETSGEGFARDYALAFLSDVNWYEIAEHMLDEIRAAA